MLGVILTSGLKYLTCPVDIKGDCLQTKAKTAFSSMQPSTSSGTWDMYRVNIIIKKIFHSNIQKLTRKINWGTQTTCSPGNSVKPGYIHKDMHVV